MMHHHVFDELNSRELLEAVGFKVLAVEMQLSYLSSGTNSLVNL